MSFRLLLTSALLGAGSSAALNRIEFAHVPVPLPARAAQQAYEAPEAGEQASRRLEEKAREQLAATRALVEILEADLAKAKSRRLQFVNLYGEGLVARRERAEMAARVEKLEARLKQQREVLSATGLLLTELTREGMGKQGDSVFAGTAKPVRTWNVGLVPELANFFWHRFKRELPISAFGQTPTHDYLGFDHRDRVDLALHPASDEGEAVIEYLRQRNLPFQAFSTARTGSATGAHIHVGPVSGRLLEE